MSHGGIKDFPFSGSGTIQRDGLLHAPLFVFLFSYHDKLLSSSYTKQCYHTALDFHKRHTIRLPIAIDRENLWWRE